MPKFLLFYTDQNGTDYDSGTERSTTDGERPNDTDPLGEERDDVEEVDNEAADATADLQEWMAWSERIGDALLDFGLPVGSGRAVSAAGSSDATSSIAGYSIIEAADMEAATDLIQGHPHLKEGTIELYETFPIPGV